MQTPYPIRLTPAVKSPIWGGTRLKTAWGVRTDAPTVGEAWVLCVRPGEQNRIENGPWEGRTLNEVVEQYGESAGQFPLLIKLLHAADTLSVQVHPDDDYAARVENDRGKTEMWHILEAEPGSELIFGIRPGYGKEKFAEAVRAGDPERALGHVPVKPGETYFIPAGMPHAIGKGILLAEIQQNCDLTYRLWDFGRLGLDGKPRELHVAKALDVSRPFAQEEIDAIRYARCPDADRETVLADCACFRVEKRRLKDGDTTSAGKRFRHLLCLSGEGSLTDATGSYPVCRADSYLLPPGGCCAVRGDLTVLLSEP